MRCKILLLITLVSLFLIPGLVEAREVKGQIVAVNEVKESVLLRTDAKVVEYKLGFTTDIKLNNKNVKLNALRPIDYKSFCEAKLRLNQANEITNIKAAYKAVEVLVTKVTKDNLVIKKIDTGITREFEIDQQVEIMRNNLKVSLKDLMNGDKGLIILGLNNKIKKVIIHNYQVYGFLKDINADNRKLVINVGSRSKPKYKSFKLPKKAKVKSYKQEIALDKLRSNMWVKLEFGQKLKKVVVKNLI